MICLIELFGDVQTEVIDLLLAPVDSLDSFSDIVAKFVAHVKLVEVSLLLEKLVARRRARRRLKLLQHVIADFFIAGELLRRL